MGAAGARRQMSKSLAVLAQLELDIRCLTTWLDLGNGVVAKHAAEPFFRTVTGQPFQPARHKTNRRCHVFFLPRAMAASVIAAANILPSLQRVQHARPHRRCHCPAHGGGDNDAIAMLMSDVRSFGARSELPDVRRRR